jgi:hypothetical protein
VLEGIAHLTENFPQVVSAKGGPEALLAPGQLAVLLHAVEDQG